MLADVSFQMKPPEYLENSLDAKEDAFLMETEMRPEFSELAGSNYIYLNFLRSHKITRIMRALAHN